MAEIWVVSGTPPVKEEELDELDFEDCVELLELSESLYLGEDPTQAHPDPDLELGERYVIVAVAVSEASDMGWKPGYYPSPLDVDEALSRLDPDDDEDEYDDDDDED
jgi:hypothetical protein